MLARLNKVKDGVETHIAILTPTQAAHLTPLPLKLPRWEKNTQVCDVGSQEVMDRT